MAKSSNPVEAARRAARKRELKRNKSDREQARIFAAAKKDDNKPRRELEAILARERNGEKLDKATKDKKAKLEAEIKKLAEARDKLGLNKKADDGKEKPKVILKGLPGLKRKREGSDSESEEESEEEEDESEENDDGIEVEEEGAAGEEEDEGEEGGFVVPKDLKKETFSSPLLLSLVTYRNHGSRPGRRGRRCCRGICGSVPYTSAKRTAARKDIERKGFRRRKGV